MRVLLDTFDETVRKIWLQAVKAYGAVFRAVRHYNKNKSHAYYVKLKTYFKRSRRTGHEKLRCIIAEIPTPSLGKEEYLILVFYMSRQRKMHRQNFNRRMEYLLRELRKLTDRLEGSEFHIFIYFIGYQFRVGVYERVKEIRKNIASHGYNILLRLIELRYDSSLYELVFRDVFRFLSSRAYKLIESSGFRRANGMVFSKPKHFLDWILLVLTYLREDKQLMNIVEDLMMRTEVPINKYKDLLLSIDYGSPGQGKEEITSMVLRPSPLATPKITYGIKEVDNDQDEENESLELVEDRYERVDDDKYEPVEDFEVI